MLEILARFLIRGGGQRALIVTFARLELGHFLAQAEHIGLLFVPMRAGAHILVALLDLLCLELFQLLALWERLQASLQHVHFLATIQQYFQLFLVFN